MAVYKRVSQSDNNDLVKKNKSSLRPVKVIRNSSPAGMVRKKGNKLNPTVTLSVDRDTGRVLAIKSDRVFAQIARMSRNPKKMPERALLVGALNEATVSINRVGNSKKVIPGYVPMSEDVAKLCFGNRLDRLPKTSIIHLEEESH